MTKDRSVTLTGPAASLGIHIELDVALDSILGKRMRTVRTKHLENGRQVAPKDLLAALIEIAGEPSTAGPEVSIQARALARELANRLAGALPAHPGVERVTLSYHKETK